MEMAPQRCRLYNVYKWLICGDRHGKLCQEGLPNIGSRVWLSQDQEVGVREKPQPPSTSG